MKGAHYDILEALVPYEWHEVPMARAFRGRRARLKELNNMGLIHVRTVSVSAWHSPKSDPPVNGYSRQYVEAVLTEQGQDVRDAGRKL